MAQKRRGVWPGTPEKIGEGLHAVRVESGLETPGVLARRGLTKGQLSQLENPDPNPWLSTITQQADALKYDATTVFTPRDKGAAARAGGGRARVEPNVTHLLGGG